MADDKRPVIFKVKKVKEEGAHGGAWKIAYADFVTAMMAFFLLLWLLNATEQEVLEGISNYFNPTARTTSGASGSGGLFGGITTSEPGPTETKVHSAALDRSTSAKGELEAQKSGKGSEDTESTGDVGELDPLLENQQFYSTKRNMEKALDALPEDLSDLKQSIFIEVTEDGLRIELIDQRNRKNFAEGSAELSPTARKLLQFISVFIERLPNRISITGHTDAVGEEKQKWQLSIDRAAATRRALEEYGITSKRFETVIGKGDADLRDPDNPGAAANRRMSVVLLRSTSDKRRIEGGEAPPSIFDQ